MYSRGSTQSSETRQGLCGETYGLGDASGVKDDHRASGPDIEAEDPATARSGNRAKTQNGSFVAGETILPAHSREFEWKLRDFRWVQDAIDSVSEARARADELERRARPLKAASSNDRRPLFP